MKIHFGMVAKTLHGKLSTQDEMVTQAQKEHSRAFQVHRPYVRLRHDFVIRKANKMNILIMGRIGEQ
jgi:hypothetical protein